MVEPLTQRRLNSKRGRAQGLGCIAAMLAGACTQVVLGKHAETVYRDKAGRKIDPKLEWVKRREEERRKMEEDATFMAWWRG